jgi:hypothetical protein
MRRSGVQTILLVVGLIVVNCQCALTCASEPIRGSTSDIPPPCHNSSGHGKVPQKCAHSPVVAEERAPAISSASLAVVSFDAFAAGQTAVFVLPDIRQREVESITSTQPSPELILSSVLKV